ncbi:hypothetical protein ABH920_001632 [Catenulispora sp. EB89]|uniref:hypothetical protein n=1 Tax=Catenulispora sp. EB89 TaxID=3156257 RepID=UPI003510E7BA
MTIGVIVTVIVLVLIVAVAVYAARREHARRQIRASFGPEYEQVRADYGGVRGADRELARRTHLHKKLRLEPISADDQDFYTTSWEHVQGGFLDNPALALTSAEQLVARLVAARGYPATDDDDHLALLSVEHGNVLPGYRQARSVSERAATDPTLVSTEEERKALMQYRALLEDMLAAPGATVPRATQSSGVKP